MRCDLGELLISGMCRKRRKSSVGEAEGTQRVQLACFYCRTKRIRCSGERPICSVRARERSSSSALRMQSQLLIVEPLQACQKANVKCEWPSGRRKKRTRREMEEAKKLEVKTGEQVLTEDVSGLFFRFAVFDVLCIGLMPGALTPSRKPMSPNPTRRST
jgi:hypothetical protein